MDISMLTRGADYIAVKSAPQAPQDTDILMKNMDANSSIIKIVNHGKFIEVFTLLSGRN